MKVLVVDDDLDLLEALADLLECDGHQVVCAGDGRQALEKLREPAPLPDVILLDLMMPVMDGWEFRLRQDADDSLREIPVVVFSATGRVPRREQLGEVVLLHKPSNPEVLREVIARAGGPSAHPKPC